MFYPYIGEAMNKKIQKMMKERDGLRGMVPARAFGRDDLVYKEYLKSLNPRENYDVQLALADSEDVRFVEFFQRMMTPRYKKTSLPAIAKACNITLQEFNRWWQKASAQRAIAVAQTSTVDLTRDMVNDARSIDAVCERCDGLGFVAAPANLPLDTLGYERLQGVDPDGLPDVRWIRSCPMCKKEGTVRRPGDAHARDRVLEMSGLINKNKGALVSITQNFDGAGHGSAVEDLGGMTIDVEAEE